MEDLDFNLHSFSPLNTNSVEQTVTEEEESEKRVGKFCRLNSKNKNKSTHLSVYCKGQNKAKGNKRNSSLQGTKYNRKEGRMREEQCELEFFTRKNMEKCTKEDLAMDIERKLGMKTFELDVVHIKEEVCSDEEEKPCIQTLAKKTFTQKKRVASKNVPTKRAGGILQRKVTKRKRPMFKSAEYIRESFTRRNCIELGEKTTKRDTSQGNLDCIPDDTHFLEDLDIIDDNSDFEFPNQDGSENFEEYSLMIQNVATVKRENNLNEIILESMFESLDSAPKFPGNSDFSARQSMKENNESIKRLFADKDEKISGLKQKLELANNLNERLEVVHKDLRDLKVALESKENKIKTLEKLKFNIERENSSLKQKITKLEGERKNFQVTITEKESFIAEIKKSSKDLEEDKDKAIKLFQEENFNLKETIGLKKNLFEYEQERNCSLELKVADLERSLSEERNKVEELEKEKKALFKEVRKTSELQKKVRKLKARQNTQNKPFSNFSKSTKSSPGIFLKTFSTLIATSENINSLATGPFEEEVTSNEASLNLSINENLTTPKIPSLTEF